MCVCARARASLFHPAEVPVHRVHADRLSAWFRLRAVADPAPDPAKAALPASLRPWFDALALS